MAISPSTPQRLRLSEHLVAPLPMELCLEPALNRESGFQPFLAYAGLAGFGLFVVSGRFLKPNSGNRLEFAEDGGFTKICSTRLGFEYCKVGALLQCNGHEPSSHHVRLGGEFEASFATEVVHPVAPRQNPTQVSSDASMRVSRLERCIAQLGPSDTAELKSLQVALTKARAQPILPSMLSRDRPMWASPCGLCGVSPPWKPLRAATRA